MWWEGSGEVNEPGVVPDVILCKEKQVILILQEIWFLETGNYYCTIIFYKHVSYLQQICVCVHMNTSTQLMGPTALRNISTHPNPEKLFIEKSITTIHLFTNPVFPMHMINI